MTSAAAGTGQQLYMQFITCSPSAIPVNNEDLRIQHSVHWLAHLINYCICTVSRSIT